MSRECRVIQFLGGLDQGGAESVVRDYALELTKRGYEVEVPIFYTTPNLPNQIALQEAGVRIDVFRGKYSKSIIKRGYNKILTWIYYDEKKIRDIIKDFKPDIIHIHGYTLGCFKHLDKELDGIKLYYTCHSSPSEFFCGAWKNQYSIAKRLITEHNMKMIALHEDMAGEINRMFGISNTIVLNNPISLKRFSNNQYNKIELRQKYGIPQGAFVVGHVGRFDTLKNHSLLVDIFYEIQKVKPESLLLLIAASGGDTFDNIIEKIERLGLKDNTRIMLDRDDLPALYNIMDVFIFPSKVEGFGLAALEAQASGVKCLVSENIPNAVIVSEKVIQINLNSDVNKWVECALGKNEDAVIPKSKIEDYDLPHVIDKLEEIYKLQV